MARKKRPSLDDQLNKKEDTQTSPQNDTTTSQPVYTDAEKQAYLKGRIEESRATRQKSRTPSRKGKKAISGFFDPTVSKQLRMLGIEEDRTVQSMLGEALNLLFEKYGKDAIASED